MTQHEFDIAGLSDVGRKRSENQDHFLTADLRRQLVIRETDVPRRENSEMFGRQEGSLLVVADGMGGHRDGEIASRTAVEAAARYVLDMMHWFLKLSVDEEQDFVDELSDSLKSIQNKIYSKADTSDRRMGTTVTMAYILFPQMYVIHAGDSRCYMLRAGESSSDIAGELVQAANEAGGSDNISVVVCKISEPEQEDSSSSSSMDTTINELI